MATTKQTAATATLLRVFTLLTQKEGLTTLSTVQVFLLVARREGTEGVLVKDIMRATGLTQSSVARIIAALSDQPARGMKQGLNWVAQNPDPEDPRRVRVTTTTVGQRVLSEIEAIMS